MNSLELHRSSSDDADRLVWPQFLPNLDAFERFEQQFIQLQQEQDNVEECVPWTQYQPPVKSHCMKEVVIERRHIPNVSLSILLGEGFPVRQGSSFNGSGEDFGVRPSVRINWPGYKPYSKQVHIRDSTPQCNYVTNYKVLKEIAKVFSHFIEECRPLSDGSVDDKWRLHGNGAVIKPEHIKITRVYRVARGSIQPEFAIIRKT